MTKIWTFAFSIPAVLLSVFCYGQSNKPVNDYLAVPGPILFDKKSYNLSWSSHPADNFYKQEYLEKGTQANSYKTMILMDVITGQADVKSVVASKIAELKKLKEGNPVVNYQSFENPKQGEYMIDFLLSANAADGKTMSIVERNVYRYKTFTDNSGQSGVLLFGVSTRAYGAEIDQFFSSLKSNKNDLVNKVSQFSLPKIIVRK